MAMLVELADSSSGAKARIRVDAGFNCFSFSIPQGNGRWDGLWAENGFAEGAGRPSGSGTPLLFPYPGRIAKSEFRWNERDYRLDEADGRGNAIHGFVYNRQWRVRAQAESSVAAEFQLSVDAPEAVAQWPADFRVSAAYLLHGSTLRCDLVAENVDSQAALPCGWGVHPYFRIPSPDTRVTLPVTEQWELREMLPTGRRSRVAGAEAWAAAGLPFSEMEFDDVFTGLQYDADKAGVSRIEGPGGRPCLELRFGNAFREIVVYTPGHREAVCVEPYTCLPGAILFPDLDAGLKVLSPGEQWRLWFEMKIIARP